MTITIDLATYRPVRDPHPAVYFRRTETDRRPARPVPRPNDGPGCMEARERLAQEIADSLTRKNGAAVARFTSGTAMLEEIQRRWEVDCAATLQWLSTAEPDQSMRGIMVQLRMTENQARKVMTSLSDAGHATKALNARGVAEINITDAGRSHLAGQGK